MSNDDKNSIIVDELRNYCRNLRIQAACSNIAVRGFAEAQIAALKSYSSLWIDGPSFETWWLSDVPVKEVSRG